MEPRTDKLIVLPGPLNWLVGGVVMGALILLHFVSRVRPLDHIFDR